MHIRLLYLLLLLARLAPAAAAPPAPLPTSAAGFEELLRRPGLPDTMRVICLNNLCRFAQTTDLGLARRYVDQSLALARRIGYLRGEGSALLMQSVIATASNDALTAQTKSLAALRTFRKLGYNGTMGVASCLQALGTVAVLNKEPARALRYYQQADSTFRQLKRPDLWCELNVQTNIASQLQQLGHRADALRTFRQLLVRSRGQDDSFSQIRIGTLLGLADELRSRHRPDSAVALLHEGLAIARRTKDQYSEASLLNSLTVCYGPTSLHTPRQEEHYARQAVLVGRASGQQEPLQEALINQANALHRLGRPAAYDTLLSYVNVSQQLQTAERTKALADAQTRYDVQGQQAQIRALQQDRRLAAQAAELTRLRARQQVAGLSGAALLLLLLAGGLFWQYRRRQQARQAAAAAALRQRLAADLHDDVGNLLTQIGMHSSLLRETPHSPAQTVARLDALAAASRQAAQQMSDVVWGLDAQPLPLSQLLDRLRDHAQEVLSPVGVDVPFRVPADLPDPVLVPPLGHTLYLIYKEALHNVVKHARASIVTVHLSATTECLILRLTDDGRGHNGQPRPGGHGLPNMQARAQAVGGTVRYEPQPTGFTVAVSLPLGPAGRAPKPATGSAS